jgi:hypothetical protein
LAERLEVPCLTLWRTRKPSVFAKYECCERRAIETGEKRLSYKQQENFKPRKTKGALRTRRLRSFKDVTRHAAQNRDKRKRKIKRRDLDGQTSNSAWSVSADANQIADPGLRSDDSLPQPVHSVAFFRCPIDVGSEARLGNIRGGLALIEPGFH